MDYHESQWWYNNIWIQISRILPPLVPRDPSFTKLISSFQTADILLFSDVMAGVSLSWRRWGGCHVWHWQWHQWRHRPVIGHWPPVQASDWLMEMTLTGHWPPTHGHHVTGQLGRRAWAGPGAHCCLSIAANTRVNIGVQPGLTGGHQVSLLFVLSFLVSKYICSVTLFCLIKYGNIA